MPDAPRLLVACFCAAWCGTCRDYAPLFERVVEESGIALDTAWIDIEDEAAVLGDLDVENFPTLLIAQGDEVRFWGTVMPHASTLTRMVQAAAAGALPPLAPGEDVDEDELAGLPARVRARAAS